MKILIATTQSFIRGGPKHTLMNSEKPYSTRS